MKNLIIFSLLLIVIGCAKDKGNYDYTKLNDAKVSGFNKGNGDADYTVVYGTNLSIKPIIDRTLSPDEAGLTFKWEIGKDVVSTARDLNVIVNNGFGKLSCRYTITDTRTGVKYFTDFTVNVTSAYGKGYMVLAEMEDGTSVLSFKSLINPTDPVTTKDNIEGVKYGKKPAGIVGYKKYASGPNDYKWYVYISSQIGPNPTIFTDLTTFQPQQLISAASILGNDAKQYNFVPSYSFAFTSDKVFFISEGKLMMFQNGFLYRPAAPKDPDNYSLAPWIGGVLALSQNLFIGYDARNQRFRHFSPLATDVVGGVQGDRFTFDKISEIPGAATATKGQDFFAGGSWDTRVASSATIKAILKDNSNLYFYSLDIDYSASGVAPYIPTFKKEAQVSMPAGSSNNSCAVLGELTRTWALGVGNTVYTTSASAINLNTLITLPATAGEIVKIRYIKNETQLFVATYNKDATSGSKGSLYIIDVASKKIISTDENVTGLTRDIFIAD